MEDQDVSWSQGREGRPSCSGAAESSAFKPCKRLFDSPGGCYPRKEARRSRSPLMGLISNSGADAVASKPQMASPVGRLGPQHATFTTGRPTTQRPDGISLFFRNRKHREAPSASTVCGKNHTGGTCPCVVGGLLSGLNLQEPRGSPLAAGVPHKLPTVENAEIGLPSISPGVLASMLHHGPQSVGLTRLLVVDCRYGYEYRGGHIRGAVNLTCPEDIERMLLGVDGGFDGSSTAVVFHCEFSSERGPRMYRHVRNKDRASHMADYPALSYPQMFLLKGGYKAFVRAYPDLCDPHGSYTTMADEAHADDLTREHVRVMAAWGKLKSMRRRRLSSDGDDTRQSGGSSGLRRQGGGLGGSRPTPPYHRGGALRSGLGLGLDLGPEDVKRPEVEGEQPHGGGLLGGGGGGLVMSRGLLAFDASAAMSP